MIISGGAAVPIIDMITKLLALTLSLAIAGAAFATDQDHHHHHPAVMHHRHKHKVWVKAHRVHGHLVKGHWSYVWR